MRDSHDLKNEAMYAFEVFDKHLENVKDPEAITCLESLRSILVAVVNGAFDE
jgi:hypothetical protein